MSRLTTRAIVIGAVVGLLGVASYAVADGGRGHLKAEALSGYEENPDLSTAATGTFEARIIGEKTIAYKLTYSGLEGTVQQAHIHFGKVAINGGIAAFLCSNLPSPPPGTPACPASGSVTGEIDASDVIGPEAQGIEPGAFAELIAAMRAGHTYANVHSSKWPAGEIRTQILGERKSKHDKHS
jgi:hypothetical protein